MTPVAWFRALFVSACVFAAGCAGEQPWVRSESRPTEGRFVAESGSHTLRTTAVAPFFPNPAMGRDQEVHRGQVALAALLGKYVDVYLDEILNHALVFMAHDHDEFRARLEKVRAKLKETLVGSYLVDRAADQAAGTVTVTYEMGAGDYATFYYQTVEAELLLPGYFEHNPKNRDTVLAYLKRQAADLETNGF